MPNGEPGLAVLRDIWHAQSQTSAELDEIYGHRHQKTCKNMKHVGFSGMSGDGSGSGSGTGTDDAPVDGELRAAWRERLEREGKLRPDGDSLGTLLLGPTDER
jgi:hypothetical protein